MNKRTIVLVITLIVLAMLLVRSARARVGLPAAQDSPGLLPEATPQALEGAFAPTGAEAALALTTTRVSISSAGAEGNNESNFPTLSYDGRYVVFESLASNLVPNDNNADYDVFVHDRQTGQTQRISVNSSGQEGNGKSWAPVISYTGRYVAFSSFASNLVSNDTNNGSDIFVVDRDTSSMQRVSVSSNEAQAGGGSHDPAISDNGHYIAFYSSATDLVAGDTNSKIDVFVRDIVAGETWRVSISTNGAQGNDNSWGNVSISGDGRRVGFASWASTLVPNDTNGTSDAFVRDWYNGWTAIASISPTGEIGNGFSDGTISGNGRYMAIGSDASNLVSGDTNGHKDTFVHDLDTGLTERVSVSSSGQQANYNAGAPAISTGGRLVMFHSGASNLVSGDTNGHEDVFVHDRFTHRTSRVSIATNGTQGNANSLYLLAFSGDARFVAFSSTASNLVANDGNGVLDVFVREFKSCYALARHKQSGQGDPPQATAAQSIGCEPGTYNPGETITLTANPADGWHVSSWEGTNNDSSAALDNIATMPSNDHTVRVNYAADCYTLTRNVSPSDGGSVTPNPLKSPSCPANDQYTYGTVVSLTATPNTDHEFNGWSGALSGTQNPQNLTINGNKIVTAHFSDVTAGCYQLHLDHTGSGSNPDPSSLQSSGCSVNFYRSGAVVQLTADPANGFHVAGWSGTDNDSSTSTTNMVTMPDRQHTVAVVYEQDSPTTRSAFLPSVLHVPLACMSGSSEIEPNNNAQEATGPLCFGQTYQGSPDRYDVFYIDIAQNSESFRVELLNYPDPDIQLQVHYQQITSNPIGIDSDDANGYSIDLQYMPIGRYYIFIANPNPSSTSLYSLRATLTTSCFAGPLEREPNNAEAEATGPLCPGRNYTGGHTDRYDVFSLNAAFGTIIVELENYTGEGVQLQLHYERVTGNPVGYDGRGDDGYRIELTNQPAGIYYIRIVDPNPAATITYTLRANFSPAK